MEAKKINKSEEGEACYTHFTKEAVRDTESGGINWATNSGTDAHGGLSFTLGIGNGNFSEGDGPYQLGTTHFSQSCLVW